MKRIISLAFLGILTTVFTLNFQFVNAAQNQEYWSKYPDNSAASFKEPDSFYKSLDKKQYAEFENAKLNIREKTFFKDINSVLSRADQYGKSRVGGVGVHPKRQVYVFVTVSPEGKLWTAVFDAETGRKTNEGRQL
ncbi:hypothetical protein [Neobacillus vireti]|uniref:PepSY domain-containing protein n=1 Tax=Neobacillus vireti LMG 21834 TaxID=1131730 RepID=A0AB94IRE8_9BACI|nr:hypothetical protein [Neobacillus vireti]ETI69567.1 hypothetical protein BAVI_06604 [Neobacillus vireti LMG 21834]